MHQIKRTNNKHSFPMKFTAKLKGALLAIAAVAIGGTAQAQESTYNQNFKLGVGVNAGIMTDDAYDFALGADVRLQYNFSRRTSLTLTTGFTNLFVDKFERFDNQNLPANAEFKDLGFIPVKGGFKIFWWEDQWYAMAEAGIAIPVTNDYSDRVGNSLILSPSIGYATKYVDLSLRYEHYTDFPTRDGGNGVGQVALRLAYGFKL